MDVGISVLIGLKGFSALRRMKSGEPPYSEISEGLYVGGWPCSLDKLPPGNPAIIDCTCEMPRMLEFTGNHAFLCIPTWDTRSPQPADIEAAVKWACRKRAQKIPVFIHCAYAQMLELRNLLHIERDTLLGQTKNKARHLDWNGGSKSFSCC
ncbi:hypothetical protein KY285_019585 [Solanum tuberosum]|nr:hypothetical protein KY285_019585 [Solanum tuberosum]